MSLKIRNHCSAVLATGLLAIGASGPVLASGAQGDIDFGVVYGEGSSLALGGLEEFGVALDRYSGATGRYWLGEGQAILGGLRFTTAGDQNVGFFGEYQHHFRTTAEGNSTVFIGGGLSYQELDDEWSDDDLLAVYAPFGFEFPMANEPISFTVNSSLTAYIDPESEVEFADEIRLGVHYRF